VNTLHRIFMLAAGFLTIWLGVGLTGKVPLAPAGLGPHVGAIGMTIVLAYCWPDLSGDHDAT
jgi:hypothetical protein